jgi:hypothetical protein
MASTVVKSEKDRSTSTWVYKRKRGEWEGGGGRSMQMVRVVCMPKFLQDNARRARQYNGV